MVKKRVRNKSIDLKSRKFSDNSTVFAFIAAFLSIVGFILAILLWKDDEYVMYYAKQSLLIFVIFVIGAVVSVVPSIGNILGAVVYLVGVIFWLMSWIYALSGEKKQVPIIGPYAESMKV
ncbi:hypothetical protein J4477_04800 [Candidatus Pacearchaeota archaeon]|nr:hypothetical protein [Candidatus Pacearchaeota archaeon]